MIQREAKLESMSGDKCKTCLGKGVVCDICTLNKYMSYRKERELKLWENTRDKRIG